MGNADLRQLAAIEGVPFDTLAGETVAIDAHNWLYRYLTVTVRYTNDDVYTTPDGTEVANLVAILQGLPRLLEHGVTPVFVFDGAPSELKEAEISERRASKEQREEELEAARERGDALEVARLDSQTQRLTDTIIETSRELLSRLDIPVVDAPAEGEAQAAYMSTEGDVDAVGTEDYDALLFGAPVTYRDLSSSGDIERMDLAATLSRHDLEYEQLVDVAILCGTDFNEGLHGVGPKTAVDLVHDHDTLDGVLAAREDDIPGADRVRSLFLDPTVTDDYEYDTAVAPDVESAREFVIDAWGVSASAVESYLDRIADATKQTGLDQFT